jgi:hypothetical protein
MNAVIIGRNDRMVCQYRNICREYNCKAKIYTRPKSNLECLMGNPDWIVLFTDMVSHETIKIAKKRASGTGYSADVLTARVVVRYGMC